MKHKVYKTIALTILFSIGTAISGYSRQQAPAKPAEAAKAPIPTETSELNALKQKQADLSKELKEVTRKLAEEQRKVSLERYKADTSRYNRLNLNSRTAIASLNTTRLDSAIQNRVRTLTRVTGNLSTTIARSFDNMNFSFNSSGKSLDFSGDYKGIEKSKTISRSYPVGSNDKLAISNQYGKVTVNTWNKKEIKVDVEIKAYHNSEDHAQELLDGVTINDSKQNNLISFKTDISRKQNENWFVRKNNGVEERRGVQVNYVVYMPAKSSLDVSNSYGAVVLPDMDGVIKAKVTYGSLKAGKLSNPANEIRNMYSPTSIESMQSGTLISLYGKTDIEYANNVNIDLKYASGSRIGKLTNGGEVSLKYSSGFKIDELDGKVKTLTITSSYSPISITTGQASFGFDITVKHAGFNYSNGKINVVNKEPADHTKSWNPTQNYKGQCGNESDSKVVINSTYGSVNFL